MKRTLVIAILALLLTAPLAHANLILNPSFESVSLNWSYGNVDWWTGWTAKDGNVSIDVSGGNAGWISQTFATEVGHEYEVTFWMAGNTHGIPTFKSMYVSAGNVTDLLYQFDKTGYSDGNMGWTEKSFLFTAIASTTTLLFESLDYTAYGPAIDLVSVEEAAAVPLPAAFLLFGPGLGVLAALKRKHRAVSL